jgi:hypothetical protein
VQASIFPNPCYGVSSVGHICSMVGSDTMLNYQLSQKLKLIGRGKFNHLTITLIVCTLGFNLLFDFEL